MKKDMRAIVIGGGITGCSIAYLLNRQGYHVTIIEKDSELGGLAKTYCLEGLMAEFGPHILHTGDKEIKSFLEELVDIRNNSTYARMKLKYSNGYFDYPISYRNVEELPGKIGNDVRRELKGIGNSDPKGDNFEDYVSSLVGKTLYRLFIKNYTRKLWGIDPRRMLNIWAPQRISIRKTNFKFFENELVEGYPSDGYNGLMRKLAEDITIIHGKYLRLISQDNTVKWVDVRSNNQRIKVKGDLFFSTIPIDVLLNYRFSKLNYRCLVVLLLSIDKEYVFPKRVNWVYYPNTHKFTRITHFTSYTKQKTKNRSVIGLEFPTSQRELKDIDDKRIVLRSKRIIKKLFNANLLSNMVIKKEHAYPVATRDNFVIFGRYLQHLVHYHNLFSLGRLGLYTYKNMDECIKMSLLINKSMLTYKEMTEKERLTLYGTIIGHSLDDKAETFGGYC